MTSVESQDEDLYLARLLRYCLYQERSTHEVQQKLTEWECESLLAERLMEYVQAERYVDNDRFAYQYAHGKFTLKKWGRLKIIYGLKTIHRLPSQTINQALHKAIDPDDYYNMILRLTEKKWLELGKSRTLTTKGAVSRYLHQKGYEWDLITEAIQEIIGK
jgi:regulatory protein